VTVAKKIMTLAEYLEYDDGTDQLYELENGELLEMPPESFQNQQIAIFLLAHFLEIGIPSSWLKMKVEIVVLGGRATARVPDLMVLSEELERELRSTNRATVLLDMSPPSLVIEVVSPRQDQRDYRHKRSEYAARKIPEYWIVDPLLNKVTVLELLDGMYEEVVYLADESFTEPLPRSIASPTLGNLELTAQQILAG
jgi:Uma2 family endonuclease